MYLFARVQGKQRGFLKTCKTFNRWIKVICTRANMMWRRLTVIPDVPPAGDIAQHATWEQGARGGQADRTDIIWPGYRAGQLHQRQVPPAVRFDVSGWNHHSSHTVHWLVRVEAIQLVPASVDDVRAHVGWTEGRHRGQRMKPAALEMWNLHIFYIDKGYLSGLMPSGCSFKWTWCSMGNYFERKKQAPVALKLTFWSSKTTHLDKISHSDCVSYDRQLGVDQARIIQRI